MFDISLYSTQSGLLKGIFACLALVFVYLDKDPTNIYGVYLFLAGAHGAASKN
jgi:hypothetical protein